MPKMTKTAIQWCTHTANPVRPVIGGKIRGYYCEAVAPECQGCYAEAFNQNRFFGGNGLRFTQGQEVPEHTLVDEILDSWKSPKSKPKVIFLESMSDLGGHWVKENWVQAILDAQLEGSGNVYMNLSKRPDRLYFSVQRFLARHGLSTLPRHMGIGTSAGTQQSLRRFLPWLLFTPAEYRFISAEPLLEDLWLDEGFSCPVPGENGILYPFSSNPNRRRAKPLIHQVIIGGHSAKDAAKAKSFHIDHAVSLTEQLQTLSLETAIFWKQLGSKPFWRGERVVLPGKAGDPDQWPAGLPYYQDVPAHLVKPMIDNGKQISNASLMAGIQ